MSARRPMLVWRGEEPIDVSTRAKPIDDQTWILAVTGPRRDADRQRAASERR